MVLTLKFYGRGDKGADVADKLTALLPVSRWGVNILERGVAIPARDTAWLSVFTTCARCMKVTWCSIAAHCAACNDRL